MELHRIPKDKWPKRMGGFTEDDFAETRRILGASSDELALEAAAQLVHARALTSHQMEAKMVALGEATILSNLAVAAGVREMVQSQDPQDV